MHNIGLFTGCKRSILEFASSNIRIWSSQLMSGVYPAVEWDATADPDPDLFKGKHIAYLHAGSLFRTCWELQLNTLPIYNSTFFKPGHIAAALFLTQNIWIVPSDHIALLLQGKHQRPQQRRCLHHTVLWGEWAQDLPLLKHYIAE